MTKIGWLLLPALMLPAFADDKVYQVGKNVTAPHLLHKIEPKYSRQALDARVQGSAVFEIVIDEQGVPGSITLISPLGFGLDEQAEACIALWRFAPGQKDGQPVKVSANVEVNFRLLPTSIDLSLEQQRTAFNIALAGLQKKEPGRAQKSLESVEKLAGQKYPAAMNLMGRLYWNGEMVDKDRDRARTLWEAAAKKHFGPAIYQLGRLHEGGGPYPADPDQALKMYQQAAQLGSMEAQYALGVRYARGEGVQQDTSRARRNFRLCAAAGDSRCQLELARIMVATPARGDHEYLQGIAWCELAAEKNEAGAQQLLDEQTPKLTEEQHNWVKRLKVQLSHRS